MIKKKWIIGLLACPLTVLIAMVIVYSLNLFPRTIINGLSSAAFSFTRCEIDQSNLHPKIGKKRRLRLAEVRNIIAGNVTSFRIGKEGRILRFRQIGTFLSIPYGNFHRKNYQLASTNRYYIFNEYICLFSRRYIGPMWYYTDANRNLFEITYSDHTRKIYTKEI